MFTLEGPQVLTKSFPNISVLFRTVPAQHNLSKRTSVIRKAGQNFKTLDCFSKHTPVFQKQPQISKPSTVFPNMQARCSKDTARGQKLAQLSLFFKTDRSFPKLSVFFQKIQNATMFFKTQQCFQKS